MTTNGTVLQTGDPAAVGMSAAQLERAFGLLTAAVEAGQISAASLTVARHGKEVFARGAGQAETRHRSAGRCGLDLSPRVDHQAGHRLRTDDPRRPGTNLARRPSRRLPARVHRRRPARHQGPPPAIAHIGYARYATGEYQPAAGARASRGLCRARHADAPALQTSDRFPATRARAYCWRPRSSSASVASGCATLNARKFSRRWAWSAARWAWVIGRLKIPCGAGRTPKRTTNCEVGGGIPRTGATLGHRGAACTAPDAI